MIIYKSTNKINGKCYIGQSAFSLERRKIEHEKSSRKTKVTAYFHKAIKKYGENNFKQKILYECNNKKELNTAEIYYINKFNSFGENGYNLTEGGNGSVGYKPTPETLKKISEKTKEGIAKSNKSWSESHKGEKNGMYGKTHTKESKQKMKENRTGLMTGDDNPSVKTAGTYKITLPDGVKIVIQNLRKFCREKNLKSYAFYNMCDDKRKSKYKGYWCERLEYSNQRKKELNLL